MFHPSSALSSRAAVAERECVSRGPRIALGDNPAIGPFDQMPLRSPFFATHFL